MLKPTLLYRNHSDVAIIVAHEIYGINRHMAGVCDQLSQHGYDVYCRDLLAREHPFAYEEEAEAYRHFMEKVGFENASSTITSLGRQCKNQYRRVFLVGFNVGATAAWLCDAEAGVCDGIVGYYGSRIRDYTDVEPSVPVLLLYGSEERACDVDSLILSLRQKKNVSIRKLAGQHGFADPHSRHYHEESARRAFAELLRFVRHMAE